MNLSGFTYATKLAALLACVLLAACARNIPPPVLEGQNLQRVDFSGNWQLDYALSENLYEKIEMLQRIAMAAARNRPAPTTRRGPVFMVNNRQVGSSAAIISLGQMAEIISRATTLEIEQSGDEIEVMRKDDFPLTCNFYGGQAEAIEDILGTELCGWDYHQLIFHVALPDGFTIFHRMTLAEEGDKINIATTVRSNSLPEPFTLNRVYQRFDPVPDEFECETTVSKGKSCRRAAP